MALTTGTTSAQVAIALGQSAPDSGSTKGLQWAMWIADALRLIQRRVTELSFVEADIDQSDLDYVVRQAVVAQVRNPDASTSTTTTVDDTTVSKVRQAAKGEVGITDEWWALLGLAPRSSGAFSIIPSGSTEGHLPWCSLAFGATYCSCGVDIAGVPIFENPDDE